MSEQAARRERAREEERQEDERAPHLFVFFLPAAAQVAGLAAGAVHELLVVLALAALGPLGAPGGMGRRMDGEGE